MPYIDSEWDKRDAVPASDLAKVAALLSGTDGMRRQGERYLPRFAGETPTEYRVRLNRSWLYPEFERLVKDYTGRVLGNSPVYPELNAYWAEWVKRADPHGRSLHQVLREGFQYAVADGMAFGIVDTPFRPAEETGEDALERRPWIEIFKAERLVNWKGEMVNGRMLLTELRIDPGDKTRREYLLQDGRVALTVFDETEGGYVERERFIYPPAIDQIPAVPLYTNRVEFWMAEPPLMSVADMNIVHYQITSDYTNILTLVGCPFIWGQNIKPGTRVSPNKTVFVEGNNPVSMQFLELKGSSVPELVKRIQELEAKMEQEGIRNISAQIPNQTATEAGLQAEREGSRLKVMSGDYQSGVNELMRIVAKFAGNEWPDELKLTGNTEVVTITAQDMNVLLQMHGAGLIGDDAVIDAAKRLGWLDPAYEQPEEDEEEEGTMPAFDISPDGAGPPGAYSLDGSRRPDVEG